MSQSCVIYYLNINIFLCGSGSLLMHLHYVVTCFMSIILRYSEVPACQLADSLL